MRTPAQRAWHYCLRLYGSRWSPLRAWRLVAFLSGNQQRTETAWEEVEEALRCYCREAHTMSRHAWATMVLLAVRTSLAGCAPTPIRLAERPPPVPPGTPSLEAFHYHCAPPPWTDNVRFDVQARILYLQQASIYQFSLSSLQPFI